MHKRQVGGWFNQSVVSSARSLAGLTTQQASVDEASDENATEWAAVSTLCYNYDSNIGGRTTHLATIYREEYNCGAFEPSPTLSAMTALSCVSGRTVPNPGGCTNCAVTGFRDEMRDAVSTCTDLPLRYASDEAGSIFTLLDGYTKSMRLSKGQHAMPSLSPRPTKRRFAEDLYSPAVVRGKGYWKEGLCALCPTPAWFKIKQSAYWYHMNFTHGISAMTGRPYEMPSQYQVCPLSGGEVAFKCRDTPQACSEVQVEGLCGCCGEWISIVVIPRHKSSLPFSAFNHSAWYKHSQKCHQKSHSKRTKRVQSAIHQVAHYAQK